MRHVRAIRVVALLVALASQGLSSAQPYGDAWFDLIENGALTEIVAALEAGADPNAQTDSGRTPLMAIACCRDDVKIALVLLDHGADVTLTNRFDNTALHIAARTGSPAMVRTLLNASADATAVNIYGDTPGDLAEHNESLQGAPGLGALASRDTLALRAAIEPHGGRFVQADVLELDFDLLVLEVAPNGDLLSAQRAVAEQLEERSGAVAVLVQDARIVIVTSGSSLVLRSDNVSPEFTRDLLAGSTDALVPDAFRPPEPATDEAAASEPRRVPPTVAPARAPSRPTYRRTPSTRSTTQRSSTFGDVTCRSTSGPNSSSVSCTRNGQRISRTTCTMNPRTYEVNCTSWDDY